MTVSLTGYMGAGKTSTGRALAAMLGWDFTDLDECIVHKKGMSIAEFIRTEGEDAFRAVEAECLRDTLIMHSLTGKDLVLALGGGTVTIGAVQHLIFGETECVWLEASLETIKERIGDDLSSRPLFSEELYKRREAIYAKAPFRIRTDGLSPEEVASAVRTVIGR